MLSYKSGQDFDLQVNAQALKLCATWFDQVTDPITGQCGYTKRGEPSSRHPGDHATRFPPNKGEALTAVGLMCRFFLGQDPKDHSVMTQAAETLLKKPPVWEIPTSVPTVSNMSMKRKMKMKGRAAAVKADRRSS